jgi:hypothetical protein
VINKAASWYGDLPFSNISLLAKVRAIWNFSSIEKRAVLGMSSFHIFAIRILVFGSSCVAFSPLSAISAKSSFIVASRNDTEKKIAAITYVLC